MCCVIRNRCQNKMCVFSSTKYKSTLLKYFNIPEVVEYYLKLGFGKL